MKTFIKILSIIALLIGILIVILGISMAVPSSEYVYDGIEKFPAQSMSIVVGGGLFMVLGISIFILNREK